MFFWRTRSGVEVDFVVYGKSGLWAIEVKNASRLRSEDFRGLVAFREDYPQSRGFLLHRGTERLRTREGIWCLPANEFLAALHPERLIGGGW